MIELSQYLIVSNDEKVVQGPQIQLPALTGMPRDSAQTQVLGEYQVHQQQMDKLKLNWQTADTTIICATDGGLKDQVGTISYAFFLPHNDRTRF